jgi:transcriptional regulator with XRE-family HTH domain
VDRLHLSWGVQLRSIREAEGLSQGQLARASGVRQATISRIERGQQVPSDRVKWRICGALRRPLGEVFPWPEDVPPVPTGPEPAEPADR